MKNEVVMIGRCILCGKPIRLVVSRGSSKFLNIISVCKDCKPILNYDRIRPESEE